MDGTLVDSMGYWKRLAGEYLETHGVLNPPKDILENRRSRKTSARRVSGIHQAHGRGTVRDSSL